LNRIGLPLKHDIYYFRVSIYGGPKKSNSVMMVGALSCATTAEMKFPGSTKKGFDASGGKACPAAGCMGVKSGTG